MTTVLIASERRKRLKLKRIVISEHNYLALKKVGYAGDSFNDVVSKLLRVYRAYKEKKQQQEEQQQQENADEESITNNDNRNSSNSGLLFPPSPTEIVNEQNRQQLDVLIRSLQNKRGSRNDQSR